MCTAIAQRALENLVHEHSSRAQLGNGCSNIGLFWAQHYLERLEAWQSSQAVESLARQSYRLDKVSLSCSVIDLCGLRLENIV